MALMSGQGVCQSQPRFQIKASEPRVTILATMNFAGNSERHAVVDVGTNSVKLLVADVGHELRPVLELARTTRLGEGSFHTGRLQREAIARTVVAVTELVAKAAELGPVSLRIVATCATREARNGQELVQAIFKATGLSVEILSGLEEAAQAFRGVMSEPGIGRRPVLIVDVGGGSTEWVVGEDGFTQFTTSTRLGTSRLLEMFPPSDPPTPGQLARTRRAVTDFLSEAVCPQMRPVLAAFCGRPISLVGVGGASKSLAGLTTAPAAVAAALVVLRAEQISAQVERLWGLPLQERRKLSGLAPEKADVILAGAVIFEAVMRQFDFTELIHSSRGLRTGILMTSRTQAAKPDAHGRHPIPVPPLTGLWEKQPPPAIIHQRA